MTSWSVDEVVLLQTDGGNDRLKMIYQAFKEVFIELPVIPYTGEDGWDYLITNGRHKALTKWKKDYPDAELSTEQSMARWLGNILPVFDLHHWYEGGGQETTMSSYVNSVKESGVFSEIEEGKKPHIHIKSLTSWTVVQDFWIALCEKYDLECLQMGVDEDFSFAFNTDTSYQYLPTRYVVNFYDEWNNRFKERLIANTSDLMKCLTEETCIESLEELIPFIAKEITGNLRRSKNLKEMIEEELSVEKLIDAANERLVAGGSAVERITYIELTNE